MGRDAYLLRLALGRSADLPPDWSALVAQYSRLEEDTGQDGASRTSRRYRQIDDSSRAPRALTYDEKGRPTDPELRKLDDKRCEAQNEVLKLAVAGASESSLDSTIDELAGLDGTLPSQPDQELLLDEDDAGTIINWIHLPLQSAVDFWVSNLLFRVTTFSSSLGVPLTQQILVELRQYGVGSFLFAGLPTAFVSRLCEFAVILSLGEVEARVMERLPSTVSRNARDNASFVVELGVDLFVRIPFFAFSILQSLQLIPASRKLPPLAAWNVISAASPYSSLTFLQTTLTSVPFAILSRRLLLRMLLGITTFIENYVASPHPPSPAVDLRGGRRHAVTPESYDRMVRVRRAKRWLGRRLRSVVEVLGWARKKEDGYLDLSPSEYPYRVNDLNEAPAGSAAEIVADTLTLVPRLLIDAALYRTVALRFLDGARTLEEIENAHWFRGQIFPNLITPFMDVGQVQKIGLCVGIQLANNIALLCFKSRLTIWAGRRWYGWGQKGRTKTAAA